MLSHESLEEIFRDLIGTSVKKLEAEISPMVEEYMVDVTTGLATRPHLMSKMVYINDLLHTGLDSAGYIRREYLRITGDIALCISGIFPDSLESRRTQFNVGDYIDIGAIAYGNINVDIFDEMSEKFPQMVDILNLVSMRVALTSKDLANYIKRRRMIDARASRR